MLRKIQKISRNPFVAILLAAVIAFPGCTKQKLNPAAEAPAKNTSGVVQTAVIKNSDFTGEEMFRGVFFMRGGFADVIPSYDNVKIYKDATDEVLAAVDEFQNRVIDTIHKRFPFFFSSFELELKSGSATRIDMALDKAAGIALSAIKRSTPDSIIGIDSSDVVIHKMSSAYNDVNGTKILTSHPELLRNNSLASPKELFACAAVVTVFYFAAAVHNTLAVTVLVVAVGAGAVYLAIVLWKGKWFWNGNAVVQPPSNGYPENLKGVEDLNYDNFVSDLSKIDYSKTSN